MPKSSKDLCALVEDPSLGFDSKLIPRIFTHFDTEFNGYLSRAEATHFFDKIVKYSKGRWNKDYYSEWFAVLDPTGEGKLLRKNMSQETVGNLRDVDVLWLP